VKRIFVHIFSLFNLPFFRIFPISSLGGGGGKLHPFQLVPMFSGITLITKHFWGDKKAMARRKLPL
jgi:hypothetical protein